MVVGEGMRRGGSAPGKRRRGSRRPTTPLPRGACPSPSLAAALAVLPARSRRSDRSLCNHKKAMNICEEGCDSRLERARGQWLRGRSEEGWVSGKGGGGTDHEDARVVREWTTSWIVRSSPPLTTVSSGSREPFPLGCNRGGGSEALDRMLAAEDRGLRATRMDAQALLVDHASRLQLAPQPEFPGHLPVVRGKEIKVWGCGRGCLGGQEVGREGGRMEVGEGSGEWVEAGRGGEEGRRRRGEEGLLRRGRGERGERHRVRGSGAPENGQEA